MYSSETYLDHGYILDLIELVSLTPQFYLLQSYFDLWFFCHFRIDALFCFDSEMSSGETTEISGFEAICIAIFF
jgi:hypothetical protein